MTDKLPNWDEINEFLKASANQNSRMFSVVDHLTYEIQEWIARGFDK